MIGVILAAAYAYKTRYNPGFVRTLAILPAVVCVVIMMVNGNVGTGVAVAGAFSLVRFRSVPGSAKDIGAIFSKEDLTLNGSGSMTVTSAGHGIVSKDDLVVIGGTYEITAEKQGVSASQMELLQSNPEKMRSIVKTARMRAKDLSIWQMEHTH